MPTINQLSAVDSVTGSDQLPIYSSEAGDARKASLNVLKDWLQNQLSYLSQFFKQFAAPSATGFSVTLNNDSQSVWLVLTPVAGYAAGTLVLPAVANCVDQQEILVNSTQAVTALTVSGNGSTVTGAPTTLAANGFFRLKHEAVTHTWYRVG